ncbi:MAG: protease SohB [Gammaproteobacteria bacterium]|nr:protease SohB [Gammaproteobacteria bacterium]
MEFLSEYGLFLAKVATLVVSFLLVAGFIIANREQLKDRPQGHIKVTNLNERYRQMKDALLEAVLDKDAFTQRKKVEAKEQKAKEKALSKQRKAVKKNRGNDSDDQAKTEVSQRQATASETASEGVEVRKRLFVLNFNGDIKAGAVRNLREEITAILQVADKRDEVFVCLESAGGMVANYGLAASQLARVRSAGVRLTVAVDKVAASGGYMMACVADHIMAAPFAMLGSIGVVAQLPNFHRLLQRNNVDFELFTAGEYKRTVTMFGENTPEGKEKFQNDLEDIHTLFQHFVTEYRPQLEIAKVATGEVWFGPSAKELALVDDLQTSDEYLTVRAQDTDLYQVEYKERHTIAKKFGLAAQSSIEAGVVRLFSRLMAWRHQAQ